MEIRVAGPWWKPSVCLYLPVTLRKLVKDTEIPQIYAVLPTVSPLKMILFAIAENENVKESCVNVCFCISVFLSSFQHV